jgi:predicted SprT family Zn-dependent metalloprotease
MFATTQETEIYIRMTLKQWGMSDIKIEWVESTARWLGLAYVQKKKIKLNKIILISFNTFEEVLKHEIAHFIQYKRNGNRWLTSKTGREMVHGKDFAAVCKEMGIRARTKIPIPKYIYV